MRNQYKVLSEKYELEVEAKATPGYVAFIKAVYNADVLTKDFLPAAINIYNTQIEPIMKSWPDFDILTDKSFPYNITVYNSLLRKRYREVTLFEWANWAEMMLYGANPVQAARKDTHILEGWFVCELYYQVYVKYDQPKDFYHEFQRGRVPTLKSNAEFIQFLIDQANVSMKDQYDRILAIPGVKKAVSRFRAIKAAQTQHTKTHGIDLRDW